MVGGQPLDTLSQPTGAATQELPHRPVPGWLGKAQSLAEPQSQEGGKGVARGWDASSAR